MIYIRISLCVTPGTPPVVVAPLGGDQSVSRILKLSTHRLSLDLSSGHDDAEQLARQIQASWDEGKELVLTVLKSMNQEQVNAQKEAPKSED